MATDPSSNGAMRTPDNTQRSTALRSQSTIEAALSAQFEENAVDTTRHWLVHSVAFQVCVFGLVLTSTLLMGVEADYPEWTGFWTIVQHFYTAAFLLEMLMKLFVLRMNYFRDRGNWLDAFLVVMSVFDLYIMRNIQAGSDMSSFSILRILRLLRLIRVLRLFKQFWRFVLIMQGIADALRTTLWVGALVVVCIYACAIFCTEFLGKPPEGMYPGYSSDAEDIDSGPYVSDYNPFVRFGSMGKSMLTLANIVILAEWSEVVRPVAYKQPALIIFFLVFAVFVIYGVMNVIIGMIVDSVMANAAKMQRASELEEKDKKLVQLTKIQRLIFELDADGDGIVSADELRAGMGLPSMREFLNQVNVPLDLQAEELLSMLDDNGDGRLFDKEFERSMYRLIDSDIFQRSCINQMGINDLKRKLNTQSEGIAKLTKSVEKLQATIVELCSGVGQGPHTAAPPTARGGSVTAVPEACADAGASMPQIVAPSVDLLAMNAGREAKEEVLVAYPGRATMVPPAQRLETPHVEVNDVMAAALKSALDMVASRVEADVAVCSAMKGQELASRLERIKSDVLLEILHFPTMSIDKQGNLESLPPNTLRDPALFDGSSTEHRTDHSPPPPIGAASWGVRLPSPTRAHNEGRLKL